MARCGLLLAPWGGGQGDRGRSSQPRRFYGRFSVRPLQLSSVSGAKARRRSKQAAMARAPSLRAAVMLAACCAALGE